MNNLEHINLSEITKIDFFQIAETKLFITAMAIILLFLLIKISHYTVKIFTTKIIKATNDPERIKAITTISHVIKSTLNIFISLLVIMTALPKIGIDVRPIIAAAGVLGVAVGFGARRFVEDIITGLIILLEGQVRVGDIIQIGDKVGSVEKIDLKMTVLRDTEGRVHYIRNGMIDVVTNLTRDFSYYVLNLNIATKENIDNVMNVVKDIFYNELSKNSTIAEKIIDEIEILGIDSFSETSVVIKIRIKTKPMEQWTVGREFNRLIKNKFDELNIEMYTPSN